MPIVLLSLARCTNPMQTNGGDPQIDELVVTDSNGSVIALSPPFSPESRNYSATLDPDVSFVEINYSVNAGYVVQIVGASPEMPSRFPIDSETEAMAVTVIDATSSAQSEYVFSLTGGGGGGGGDGAATQPTVSIELSGLSAADAEYLAWLTFVEYETLYDGSPATGLIGPYTTNASITGGSVTMTLPYPGSLDPLSADHSYLVLFDIDVDGDLTIGESDVEGGSVHVPENGAQTVEITDNLGYPAGAPGPTMNTSLNFLSVEILNNDQISIGTANLSPGFDPQRSSFSSTLEDAQPYVAITASPMSSIAAVTIDELQVYEGDEYRSTPIELADTDPLEVTIAITIGGTAERVYALTVNRPVDDDTYLQSLEIEGATWSPSFSQDTTSYEVELEYEDAPAQYEAESSSAFATLSDGSDSPIGTSGAIGLAVGETPYTFRVHAEDGSTRDYEVSFDRLPDTRLDSFSVTPGTLSPSFDPQVSDYTLTIPWGASSIDVTTSASDDDGSTTLTYSINGVGSEEIDETPETISVADGDSLDVIVDNSDGSASQRTYSFAIAESPAWEEYRDDADFDLDTVQFDLYSNGGTLYALVSTKTAFATYGGNSLLADTGSGWAYVGSPDFTGEDAGYAVMAFADDGTPYVAVEDNGIRVYTYDDGSGTWSTVGGVVGTTELEEYYDIAIDDSGNPWVAFSDYEESAVENELTIKQWSGSSWDLVGTRGFTDTGGDEVTFGRIKVIDLEFDGGELYLASNGHDGAGADIVVYTLNGSSWERFDNGSHPLAATNVYGVDLEIVGTTAYLAYNTGTPTRAGLLTADTATAAWSEIDASYPSSGNATYSIELSFSGSVPIVSFQDGNPEFGAIVAYAYDSGWSRLGTDVITSSDAMADDSRNPSSVVNDGELYVGWRDAQSEILRGFVKRYTGLLP